MNEKTLRPLLAAAVLSFAFAGPVQATEQLGRALFFDPSLSLKGNLACASCHAEEVGWSGPTSAINAAGAVFEGSVAGRFSNRKPPSAAYATFSPVLHTELDDGETLVVGGNFWDGHATGEKLGNPAADQAQFPFLNPTEQALSQSACVVYRACTGSYKHLVLQASPRACAISWPSSLPDDCATGRTTALSARAQSKVDATYNLLARAIAAFERSRVFNAFSSKFDAWRRGKAQLSSEEQEGFTLFEGKAKCANCHISTPGPHGEPPLFTDFTYDNIGVPRNPDNPFYKQAEFNPLGDNFRDRGLGTFIATQPQFQAFAEVNVGKQKVPTLRNVDKRPRPDFVKAFMHNGYFKTLEGVVNFYNTRRVKPHCANPLTRERDALQLGCWPMPEIARNVNVEELGNLRLTAAEEHAVVAFLKTLSDGYDQGR